MGSPWKALSDDNRRQIVLLLKNKDMIPTQIADELNFTLPAVSIKEKKQGKYRYYSLNRKTTSELAQFFDDMYDYNLKSLKEYVENKENKKRSRK